MPKFLYTILLVLALLILVLIGISGIYFLYYIQKTTLPKTTACTMEAKLCPDGSYVGRTGPNCEFSACPTVKPPEPAEKSGITGIAMLGPFCPVERIPPDPNCADRPYKTELMATDSSGMQLIATFSSATDGKFSVDLAPGQYLIVSSNTSTLFSHCQSNGPITVLKNQYTDITLHCDTGIR